jgi:hypothetical protein
MAAARRTIQPKSCPKGHLYVGEECPCEHSSGPLGAHEHQVARQGSTTQGEPTRNLPKTPSNRVEGPERTQGPRLSRQV